MHQICKLIVFQRTHISEILEWNTLFIYLSRGAEALEF